ncbi:MAG TPA: type IV secretory system conjugative DNA transfer family protein [Burkholderiales bacterium]|nr:type IV secretory system conjugative DNA transfer family protein [Burkholderiales bacterium]
MDKYSDSLKTPLYDVPDQPGNPGGILWKGIGGGICFLMALSLLCTQYLAFRFGYQDALGAPLFSVGGFKFYMIFDWVEWYGRFGKLKNPTVQSALSQVLWLFVASFTGTVALIFYTFNKTLKSMDKGGQHIHGSAHWASPEEVQRTGLIGTGVGVYVGAWKHPKTGKVHYLRHDGPEHIMAFAPTRSGKGVGLVLPTLLSWPHSVVVYDIKGENWALTAGWRQKEANNHVLKFEPTAIDGSSIRYNPMDLVRVYTDKEVADVQNIMNMIADPEGKGLADHWQKTGHALLVGTALHVLYAESDKSLCGVIGFLSNPARTIQDSLNYMLNTDHDMEGVRGWVDTEGNPTFTHPVVAAVARDMLNKAEEEMSSVVSTAVSYLTLYRDPIVARNTACSEFIISDLMNDERPVSLYLVVPPSDKDRLKPLIRLVVNQVIRSLVEKMEFKDGRSVASYKHRLLLLIDEFPSLGKLDIFEESLAFIAGYGLKAYLIIQDISQLHTAYGKDESIFSNCHLRIAYAPNKVETAEMLSKMTGSTTIVKQNNSYSGSTFGILSQVSVSTAETQRSLLTADEVMRLPGARKDAQGNVVEAGDMLIFMAGQTPIYGKQILYFMDPVFSQRAKVQCPSSSDRIRNPFANLASGAETDQSTEIEIAVAEGEGKGAEMAIEGQP